LSLDELKVKSNSAVSMLHGIHCISYSLHSSYIIL